MVLVTGALSISTSALVVPAYGGGPPIGVDWLLLISVSFAFVLATTPLLALVAYVTRIGAIAGRTATFGTFTPETTPP